MKRQKRKRTAGTAQAATGRRSLMLRLRTYGLLAALVAAVGWWVIRDVGASLDEHDLARIGNGVPAVVQVHDPNCPVCRGLMREARSAMQSFDGDELQFLVADLTRDAGAKLALEHGVGKVTLLLFDADGSYRTTLSGPNRADDLVRAFRQHIDSSASAAAS